MMDLLATLVTLASGGIQNVCFLKADTFFKAGSSKKLKNYSELFNKHETLAKTTTPENKGLVQADTTM